MEASTFLKILVSSSVYKNNHIEFSCFPQKEKKKKQILPGQHFLAVQSELGHDDMVLGQLQSLIPIPQFQQTGLGGTVQTLVRDVHEIPKTNLSLPHIGEFWPFCLSKIYSPNLRGKKGRLTLRITSWFSKGTFLLLLNDFRGGI